MLRPLRKGIKGQSSVTKGKEFAWWSAMERKERSRLARKLSARNPRGRTPVVHDSQGANSHRAGKGGRKKAGFVKEKGARG